MAYCKNDFYRMYAPRCQGCKETIKNKFITALGTHWHPECFICKVRIFVLLFFNFFYKINPCTIFLVNFY